MHPGQDLQKGVLQVWFLSPAWAPGQTARFSNTLSTEQTHQGLVTPGAQHLEKLGDSFTCLSLDRHV